MPPLCVVRGRLTATMRLPTCMSGTLLILSTATKRSTSYTAAFSRIDHNKARSTMSTTKRWASSSSSSSAEVVMPRAAVSVVARCQTSNGEVSYALVQRGKAPNKGIWSFPGGKIESGEGTWDAAKRELWEETRLGSYADNGSYRYDGENEQAQSESVDAIIRWHLEGPITSSDSIYTEDGIVQWHYVISQYFAHVEPLEKDDVPPTMIPSDDAADANWWSPVQVQRGIEEGRVTPGVLRVIKRAEEMHVAGLLDCR